MTDLILRPVLLLPVPKFPPIQPGTGEAADRGRAEGRAAGPPFSGGEALTPRPELLTDMWAGSVPGPPSRVVHAWTIVIG